MSWLLPPSHHAPELQELSHREKDLGVAIIQHLAFCKSRVARLLLNNYAEVLNARVCE